MAGSCILFVTGKLAERSLRRVLDDLAPRANFEPVVVVMPITVAALMTTDWIARHLTRPSLPIDRIILPGLCSGDLSLVEAVAGATTERGPDDLRDLPEFFGKSSIPTEPYGEHAIEILAEINHAPRMTVEQILAIAEHYRASGADRIDLGCDPGTTWSGVSEAVRTLCDQGYRVSIDSFNAVEVEAALDAGADVVLSVNGTNCDCVPGWLARQPSLEVVAIPDTPSDLASLDRTIARLKEAGVRYRLDPILEPIGFGFAASLERYFTTRRRYPDDAMMMGVGNLTELTAVDSAGVNVLLAAICQELRIGSILTTEVANWCRSAVKEFDIARRMVHFADRHQVVPKRYETRLLMLRDRKVPEMGSEEMAALAEQIRDRNYRIFAERGEVHIINGSHYYRGTDPYVLLQQIERDDRKLDPSHAFYLGYEISRAITALTLNKIYTQDQPLDWGLLTRAEASRHRA